MGSRIRMPRFGGAPDDLSATELDAGDHNCTVATTTYRVATTTGTTDRRPPLPSLVPGWPDGGGARFGLTLLYGFLALLAAYGFLKLQVSLVVDESGGDPLSRWSQLLADGSGLRTSVGPWAAAVLFVFTARRVLAGRPEPPIGSAGDPSATVREMRRGLRRELAQMRWVLLGLTILAVFDATRLLLDAAWAVLRDSRMADVARDQLGWTAVEALGLIVAAGSLGVATWAFRQQVRDLGALG